MTAQGRAAVAPYPALLQAAHLKVAGALNVHGQYVVSRAQALAHNASMAPELGPGTFPSAGTRKLFNEAFRDESIFLRITRWTQWRRSRFAFGDPNNPLQFALEMETKDIRGVAKFYRTQELTDAEWDDVVRASTDRQLFERLAAEPDSKDATWVRRDDAPYYIGDRLALDYTNTPSTSDLDVPEIKLAGYVTTQSDLFDAATWLKEHVPSGTFHFHASFKMPPALGRQVAAAAAWANDFTWLRRVAEDPAWVRNAWYSPRFKENVRVLSDVLSGKGPGSRELVRDGHTLVPEDHFYTDDGRNAYKLFAVGVRGGSKVYGDTLRFGLEPRAYRGDLIEAMRGLDAQVRILEKPKRGIRLGKRSSGPRPESIARWSGWAHEEMTEVFSPGTQQYLRAINQADPERAGTDLMRWSVPLTEYEQLMASSARREVGAARRRFIELVEQQASDGIPADVEKARRQMDDLVHAWARETRIYEYF